MTRAARPARVVFIAGSSYSGSTMLGLVLGTERTARFLRRASRRRAAPATAERG